MKFIDKIKMIKTYLPMFWFYFRYLFKKSKPLFGAFFQITNKCNARCLMCFNWQILNESKDELSLGQIDRFSKTMGLVPSLTIGGGEPFLRDDLPQICEIFCKNNKTKRISIPTNSLLSDKIMDLTEKILNICSSTKIAITLSLDGVGAIHDAIRGVEGAFERFLETYNKISQLLVRYPNLKININTTVSDKNYNNISQVIDFVDKNLKVGFHTIEIIRGCYNQKNVQAISTDEYRGLIRKILLSRTINNDKYHKLIYSYYHGLSLKTIEKKKRLIPCRASSFMPVIDAKGDVYNCELLPAIGNLRDYEYDVFKILNSQKSKIQRKDIFQKKCHCTHYCYQVQNIPMSPSHFLRAICGKNL